jgi:hypothetical protein
MDFHTFTTLREACKRSGIPDDPEDFYKMVFADAIKMRSGQFYGQITNERDWERERRPYYSVWPSIVPMLTRLNLDLDSLLIRLPLPALCVRFPKQKNPLTFDWKGKETSIQCMLMGEINEGRGISILIDVGEGISCYDAYSFNLFNGGRPPPTGVTAATIAMSPPAPALLAFAKSLKV